MSKAPLILAGEYTTSTTSDSYIFKEVVYVKYINIVVIDGEEVDISTLDQEKREELANEWNRRALEVLGYKEIKTA